MLETKIIISSESAEQTSLEVAALKRCYGKSLKIGTITRRQTDPYPVTFNSTCVIYRDDTGELAFPVDEPKLLEALHPADQMAKVQQVAMPADDYLNF